MRSGRGAVGGSMAEDLRSELHSEQAYDSLCDGRHARDHDGDVYIGMYPGSGVASQCAECPCASGRVPLAVRVPLGVLMGPG